MGWINFPCYLWYDHERTFFVNKAHKYFYGYISNDKQISFFCKNVKKLNSIEKTGTM